MRKKAPPRLQRRPLVPLTPMFDFIVSGTEDSAARQMAFARMKGVLYPAVDYVVNGNVFAVPLSYDEFVRLGHEMRDPHAMAAAVHQMGWPFASLAASMAQSDEVDAIHDRQHFGCAMISTLRAIQPQALFVSVVVKGTRLSRKEKGTILQFSDAPATSKSEDVLLVSGFGPVRGYSMIIPILKKRDGAMEFQDPEISDSFRHPGVLSNPFASVFDPTYN